MVCAAHEEMYFADKKVVCPVKSSNRTLWNGKISLNTIRVSMKTRNIILTSLSLQVYINAFEIFNFNMQGISYFRCN